MSDLPVRDMAGVRLTEELVCELGLCDGGSATQGERSLGPDRFQTSVHFGVDPAHEERRHTVDD